MKTNWSGLALVLVAALGAGACSKKDDKGGGAAVAEPCETAINQAIDSMLAKSKSDSQAPSPMVDIGNKLRAIMTERCKADRWSEPSLACFRAATDQPSIKACRQGLPPEQSQRLQQEIMKVMTGGGAGGMGGGGAPPHGGGAGGAAPHGGAGGDGAAPHGGAGGAAPGGGAAGEPGGGGRAPGAAGGSGAEPGGAAGGSAN